MPAQSPRLLCCLFCLLLSVSLLQLAHAAAAPASEPTLLVTTPAERPVALQDLQIHSHIAGGVALTRIDMRFFNPGTRVLEGQLQFPLADGQHITGFALDINGQLHPAVAVDKVRARQVFESIVRRGADPALLEKTRGNFHRLRIYPLPAGGTRRVRLEYMELLPRQGGQRSWRLPLDFGAVDHFSLQLTIDGQAQRPQMLSPSGAMKWQRRPRGWQAELQQEASVLRGELRLQLPGPADQGPVVGEFAGQHYFHAELQLPAASQWRRPSPQLHLLWDASASGQRRDHARELAALDAYFRHWGSGTVWLQRLRDQAEQPRRYEVRRGNWQALRREIESTLYDGATALHGWRPTGSGDYLLVSDGLGNYGEAALPALPDGSRLYALHAATQADNVRLQALASRHGGRLLQLRHMSTRQAMQALLGETVQLLQASGRGISAVHVDGLSAPGWLRLAGSYDGRPVHVQLQLRQGRRVWQHTLQLDARTPRHALASRLWAQYRLQYLQAEPELQQQKIRELGRQFSLPTQETSLLVLESVQDHVRYDIEPPAHWRADFLRLRQEQQQSEELRQSEHLQRIADAFAEKIRWWEQRYPKDKPPAKLAVADARREAARGRMQEGMASLADADAAPLLAAERSLAPAPAAPAAAPGGARAAAADNALSITLQKWQPDEPYMQRMRQAAAADIYAIYLQERRHWSTSSAFFVDVADLLLEKKQTALGLRVLSNLAEMDLDNVAILRLLGYRLLQAGQPQLAVSILREVRTLAPDEAQSWRDLGLALDASGAKQQAIEHLYEVVRRPWDGRFAEIELIALAELNAIVASSARPLHTRHMDKRLLRNLPLDLRAVLSWDSNDSDMDLWVTDPNGEKCYYGNRFTRQGGRLSRDFTGGYGPEEFSLREARPGVYRIEANYFGDRQQVIAGATSLQLTLTTGFGTARARTQTVILRLKQQSDTVFVGEFRVQ